MTSKRFSLVASIPDANQYIGYYAAEEAENNPYMWIDSLSDEHIEIHSTTVDGQVFLDELEKFVQKNWLKINIQMFKEKIITNGRMYRVPYARLNLVGAVPNVHQTVNGEMGC